MRHPQLLIAALVSLAMHLVGCGPAKPAAEAAPALLSKGQGLAQREHFGDAIEEFDKIEQRFAANSEPVVRDAVAQALFAKGVALRRLNSQIGRASCRERVSSPV